MKAGARQIAFQPSTALRSAAALGVRLLLLAAAFGIFSTARAEGPNVSEPLSAAEDPLFSIDTSIGPIEYRVGRGLHVGYTGLNIGGFTKIDIERIEGEPGVLALDNVNFLVSWEPVPFLRGFTEIELDQLVSWETNREDVDSDPEVTVKRLYGDLSRNDALNVRFGKFQTPIGRWNLIRAEPLTWTASEPAIVEFAFPEHQTGGAIFGTTYPSSNTLSYWIYGQFMDSLDSAQDEVQLHRSVGGRLEYGGSLGEWSFGASFLAHEEMEDWNFLGGLDAQGQIGPLGLTTEFVITQGDVEDLDLWGVYVQGVYEIIPRFYFVARYEHFDPSGSSDDADLGDLGFTWTPYDFLILKLDYRVSTRETEDIRRGLAATISLLF